MAEKLALEHALGECLAVDRDERATDPVAPVMDQARDELFARAALALDEHGGVAGRDSPHQIHQGPALRAFGDDRLRAEPPGDFLAQGLVLALELLSLQRARHPGLKLEHLDRLADVVEGARAHRGHRRGDTPVAGDQDHRKAGHAPNQFVQQFGALHVRHHDVRNDDVGRAPFERSERAVTVRAGFDFALGPGQRLLEQSQVNRVILDD